MSYAATAALQAAIYARLRADQALAVLVGDAIYDTLPDGDLPALYVVIGPEQVRDASDGSGLGAEHSLQISILGSQGGFGAVKAVAAAISDALDGADLNLARGRLVGIWFLRAEARRRETGRLRRIDMTFRARIEI
jgi:hypothetical protein